jgi:hypothetical protein
MYRRVPSFSSSCLLQANDVLHADHVDAANTQNAEINLGYTTVSAPFNGVVTARKVSSGRVNMRRRFIGFYAHKKFWMLVHLGPPPSKVSMAATCLPPYEHRNIVADEIEVAFLGIELDGEAADVARQIDRTGAACDGGKSYEYLGFLFRVLQKGGLGKLRKRFRGLEIAVRTGTARMHDTLWNAFVIEMGDLLAENEIFEQARAPLPAPERILVVGFNCVTNGIFERNGGLALCFGSFSRSIPDAG